MRYLRVAMLIVGMITVWSVVARADERDDAMAALKAAQTAITQAQATVAKAQAQAAPAPPAAPGQQIDMTGIIVSVIGALGIIINTVALAFVNSYVKDKQAAVVVDNALTNALGAMQQAAQGAIINWNPKINLPASIPPNMVVGVQYTLDHAGEEAARIGLTPMKIADKLNARIGLAEIQTNIATAASDAPTPKPLDPIPPVAQPAAHPTT